MCVFLYILRAPSNHFPFVLLWSQAGKSCRLDCQAACQHTMPTYKQGHQLANHTWTRRISESYQLHSIATKTYPYSVCIEFKRGSHVQRLWNPTIAGSSSSSSNNYGYCTATATATPTTTPTTTTTTTAHHYYYYCSPLQQPMLPLQLRTTTLTSHFLADGLERLADQPTSNMAPFGKCFTGLLKRYETIFFGHDVLNLEGFSKFIIAKKEILN